MRLLFILLASVLPHVTALAQDPAPPLPSKDRFHIFILAGQSNMAGRGKLDDAARTPQKRIFSLNKEGQWQPAVDPLHWDKIVAGTGIGRPFAEVIAAQNPGISVGLVPTACGGSSISAWTPGAYFSATKSNPWDDSIARSKRALQDGILKGILWHQGEADSTPELAPDYQKRLEELITRFRAELNAPDLPFIIGQLGRFPAKPWSADRELVNAAHQAVAKKMKNVRFVATPADSNSTGDSVHFDTPTLRAFGKGYAEAYLEIVRTSKP
jgi:hypothetical protein